MRIALRILLLCLWASAAVAAEGTYPSRAITIVVPQAAGGANDTIARHVAAQLAARLGQQVVVENRAGAGGNIGTAYVAKAKADGYTLLLAANSMLVINPWLYPNPGFDPTADFAPVSLVATAGFVLIAAPSFPGNSVRDLIAAARASPRALAYGSAGNGTINHLLGEMLQKAAGIDLLHVPYRSAAMAVTDVAGGRIPLGMVSAAVSLPLVQAGMLKVLGVANEKRIAALPKVPTIGETVPGYGVSPWYGVLAPAETPKPVIARLYTALRQSLGDPGLREKLLAQGCDVLDGGPEAFAARMRDDLKKWGAVVKASGAALD